MNKRVSCFNAEIELVWRIQPELLLLKVKTPTTRAAFKQTFRGKSVGKQ
jgi:hypothetical protein